MNNAPISMEQTIPANPSPIAEEGLHPQVPVKKDLFSIDPQQSVGDIDFHAPSPAIQPSDQIALAVPSTEPLFRMDTTRNVEEEWQSIESMCATIFQQEIDMYTGKEQQKKGTIMRTAQQKLFGMELPRGHGHKGKISSKMSLLYDELTGRQPRKRRAKLPTEHEQPPLSIKRAHIRPQAILVGVVGSGPYAKLIVERLLQMQHQVMTTSKEVHATVMEDASFLPILTSIPLSSLQLQPNLRLLCNACEIIIVAIQPDSAALSFYTKKEGLLELAERRHALIDLCVEDLTISNKIHKIASASKLHYYDCLVFPQPSTLASFDKNHPSVFMGGEFAPSESVCNVLYALGKTLFSGQKNQGIIYKMIVSQYMMIQQQVLKEVYSTSSSLGVTDAKLLGRLLALCADPVTIIERNINFHLLDPGDQRSITIPISSLLSQIKRTYSLPSSFLPATSLACRVGEDVLQVNGDAQTDVSHIWDPVVMPVSNPPSL
ncbi:hypothetical protein WA556_005454, partial [Blastocystis sp. ATCC 50177/Nand II]